jgi:hypothetical protein
MAAAPFSIEGKIPSKARSPELGRESFTALDCRYYFCFAGAA